MSTIILPDTLPSENDLFEQIMLTNETVWQNICKHDIEKWLQNFKGMVFSINYERRLALWLLTNYVYYNQHEVRHLCKVMFKGYLHNTLEKQTIEGATLKEKIKTILENTRFYYLGKPSESGAFILFYFRQENNLLLKYFLPNTDRLPNNITNIVYIDDVTISGSQAQKYFERDQSCAGRRNVLLTILATNDAIKRLHNIGLETLSCITLDDRSKCFSKVSNVFIDYMDNMDNCKTFALEYGKICLNNHPVKIDPLGYMSDAYTFGFFYNTPDNTLPIFWADTSGWTPIMKRYEKFPKGGLFDDERFI